MKGMLTQTQGREGQAGAEATTADIDQALEDYINEKRQKHRDCGRNEVQNKLLELKPDALGGLSVNATPDETTNFNQKFRSCLTNVFAADAAPASVGVPAWAKNFPQDARVWREQHCQSSARLSWSAEDIYARRTHVHLA